tara:strand:+ start:3285 stop:3554 length:270 start_codon:yes stop_codon:yes gene_type:complete
MSFWSFASSSSRVGGGLGIGIVFGVGVLALRIGLSQNTERGATLTRGRIFSGSGSRGFLGGVLLSRRARNLISRSSVVDGGGVDVPLSL